jgi:hypothetical protein
MTTPSLSPEQRAIELTDAFMSAAFDEEAEASAWLAKHIAQAIHDAIDAAEVAANPPMQRWTPRKY